MQPIHFVWLPPPSPFLNNALNFKCLLHLVYIITNSFSIETHVNTRYPSICGNMYVCTIRLIYLYIYIHLVLFPFCRLFLFPSFLFSVGIFAPISLFLPMVPLTKQHSPSPPPVGRGYVPIKMNLA
jgi:hypothetical protein